jgi:hypothetical protein
MLCKKRHVLQVSAGKSSYVREGFLQITRQPIDNLRPPALSLLPLLNLDADAVIKKDQLRIDGQGGPLPGLLNVMLKLCQPIGIAFRDGE